MATLMDDLSTGTLSVDTEGFTLTVEQIAVRLTSANVSEVMGDALEASARSWRSLDEDVTTASYSSFSLLTA